MRKRMRKIRGRDIQREGRRSKKRETDANRETQKRKIQGRKRSGCKGERGTENSICEIPGKRK